MLQNASVSTQLPASDYERAKKFYQETLGFTIAMEFTAMAFEVDDVDKSVDDLAAKGITFEQFDLPYGKTDERGVADLGGWKGAFFKDSEGNILALGQVTGA